MKEHTFWQRRIIEVQANTYRKIHRGHDPRHIEAWLRTEHPTLDHLSKVAFRHAVFAAIETTHLATKAQSEALAQSYGL